MRYNTLKEWLTWLETLHPTPMDLGLERIGEVARRLGVDQPTFPIITVGGTNGKGSTVSYLSGIYRQMGYRVGETTSPHLVHFNERIRIDGEMYSDEAICQAFAEIDAVRGDITLTFFEFGMLAAVWAFMQAKVDVAILEVGLGGRLDACNLWDSDVAIVTSLALDHERWLGGDISVIAAEKAGIARAGCPLICGEPEPPHTLPEVQQRIGAELHLREREFSAQMLEGGQWRYQHQSLGEMTLPKPKMVGHWQLANAACAITAVQCLQNRLSVTPEAIGQALQSVQVDGRFQRKTLRERQFIFDVGHNPAAAQVLAKALAEELKDGGRLIAVAAFMRDKDIEGIISPLRPLITQWHLGQLEIERALAAEDLADIIDKVDSNCSTYETVESALNSAINDSRAEDRILVFGSFHTVGDVMALLA